MKEKHSMVEDGDLEIEGYQEKCRNCNLPDMQKGGGTEPHFEMSWNKNVEGRNSG
jgi:hypothetical protein